jgi:hypothetical protein
MCADADAALAAWSCRAHGLARRQRGPRCLPCKSASCSDGRSFAGGAVQARKAKGDDQAVTDHEDGCLTVKQSGIHCSKFGIAFTFMFSECFSFIREIDTSNAIF